MSKYYANHPYNNPAKSNVNKPPIDGFELPFRITSISTLPEKIKVSVESYAFYEPNLASYVPIVGLDCPITVAYGNKVWVEFFYDRNLNPIIGVVKVGNKWLYKTANTANSQEITEVYPSELELISKLDILRKLAEIDQTLIYVDSLKTLQEDEVNFNYNISLISQEQKDDYLARIATIYDDATERLNELKNNLNSYFAGAPTAIWKKLFRSFLLIGFTTKNMSLSRPGVSFFLPEDSTQQNPLVPVASQSNSYRLIQAWDSDVLLIDGIYQNRFPIKYPTPYHRAISYFSIDGEEEESINTT